MLVKTPAGQPIQSAEVSITKLRKEGEIFELSPQPTAETNQEGIAEVKINLSARDKPSGRYSFGIKVKNGTNTAKLEEWKWPRVITRRFLFDSELGMGNYIRQFKPFPLHKYNWENYPGGTNLETETNVEGKNYTAVFALRWGDGMDVSECPDSFDIDPANKNKINATYNPYKLPEYYFYLNAGNQSKLWVQKGSCNFTAPGANVYNENEDIDLTTQAGEENRTYKLAVLEVNTTPRHMVLGIRESDFNSSRIKPIEVDEEEGEWRLMALNISGVNYQVILANSTLPYPDCSEDCVKKAWVSTTGNFSGSESVGVLIGQNFTSDLYLAGIGPEIWGGITIANSSSIGTKPGLGGVRAEDGTTPYYKDVSESSAGLDLNRDGSKNETFHVVAFDDYENQKNNLTRIFVDDDLNISSPWLGSEQVDYDFYSNETGMKEREGWPPSGKWSGDIEFGPEKENASWEQQPNWDIEIFNKTDMLLFKGVESLALNQNITTYAKVYQFDKEPMQGVNISLENIVRFTSFGSKELQEGSNFTVKPIQNVTDQYGIGLIKITPVGNWTPGDYEVEFALESSQGKETMERWFWVSGLEESTGGSGGGGEGG